MPDIDYREHKHDKIGCFVIAIMFIAAIVIAMTLNDRAQIHKLDVCADRNYTAEQCKANWNKIK